MSLLKTLLAFVLIVLLSIGTVNTTRNDVPALEPPTIQYVEAWHRLVRRDKKLVKALKDADPLMPYLGGAYKILLFGLRLALALTLIPALTQGSGVCVLAFAAAACLPEAPQVKPDPYFQKATVVAKWEDYTNDGDPYGLTALSLPPGVQPEDEELTRAFWGEWTVRPAYEQAGVPYAVFLCEDAKELRQVLKEGADGIKVFDRIMYPAFALFSGKGNHLVLTEDRMSPSEWLDRLGYSFDLRGRGDRFWKGMKRYRRSVATPEIFNDCQVLKTTENWHDRKGWTKYVLRSGVTGEAFSALIRPMIEGADGQSFGTAAGVKKAWGIKTQPLKGFSISGCTPVGTLKGHMMVVTPEKEMPADFVISDPKNEMTSSSFTFNVLFLLHRYTVARTDFQSILHYGLEKFLPEWACIYLGKLKTRLMNSEDARHMLGEVDEDEEVSFNLAKLARTVQKLPFAFNKVPYFFRALANMMVASFRYLDGSNEQRVLRIPMPSDLFLRRYIAVWEDVIDETGMETSTAEHFLSKDEAIMGLGWTGKVVTWRQPNGTYREWNFITLVPTDDFERYYDDVRFSSWLNASPFCFIAREHNEVPLARWGGADFDDSVIIGRGSAIVNHFDALAAVPYPAARPKDQRPSMNNPLPEGFSMHWGSLHPLIDQAATMRGIGYYCNRWMSWNYFFRLGMQEQKYHFLLNGVEAPVHVLGNESEVIIDSFAKFGGVGLEGYDKIVKAFEDQVQWTSPSLVWKATQGDLEYGGRLGSKASTRLMQTPGHVIPLPIDEAIADVKQQIAEFEAWASETYRRLPFNWGLEPVLWQLDCLPSNDRIRELVRIFRSTYAGKFTGNKDTKLDEIGQADAFWGGALETLTPKLKAAVLSTLFREVYSETAKKTSAGYRFRGEDMLWDGKAIDHMLETVELVGRMNVAFPANHEFLVMAGIDMTPEQRQKWLALGIRNIPVTLRLEDDRAGVWLKTPTREAKIGVAVDRNVTRCVLMNQGLPVSGILRPNTSGTLKVAVELGDPKPPLLLAPVPEDRLQEQRNHRHEETDRRVLSAAGLPVYAQTRKQISLHIDEEGFTILRYGMYESVEKPKAATGHRRQLQGLLTAIERIKQPVFATCYLPDYCYGVVAKWAPEWKRDDWHKKDGAVPASIDLVQTLDRKLSELRADGSVVLFVAK